VPYDAEQDALVVIWKDVAVRVAQRETKHLEWFLQPVR
jgi:hypothetical protein